MAFLLNGQPLGVDRPFTDADGTQYKITGCVVLLLKIKQQSASLRLLTLNRMTSGFIGALAALRRLRMSTK